MGECGRFLNNTVYVYLDFFVCNCKYWNVLLCTWAAIICNCHICKCFAGDKTADLKSRHEFIEGWEANTKLLLDLSSLPVLCKEVSNSTQPLWPHVPAVGWSSGCTLRAGVGDRSLRRGGGMVRPWGSWHCLMSKFRSRLLSCNCISFIFGPYPPLVSEFWVTLFVQVSSQNCCFYHICNPVLLGFSFFFPSRVNIYAPEAHGWPLQPLLCVPPC